jgi:hypothetical protein
LRSPTGYGSEAILFLAPFMPFRIAAMQGLYNVG